MNRRFCFLISCVLINLQFSNQNSPKSEKDLSADEIELLRTYRSQRLKRQIEFHSSCTAYVAMQRRCVASPHHNPCFGTNNLYGNDEIIVPGHIRSNKVFRECGINKHSIRRKRQVDDDDIPAGEYEWPWIAALLNYNDQTQFCGGSLINHQYVLTAAHCFLDNEPKGPKDIIVRLGEWDLTIEDETRHQDFFVAEIKIHENYDQSTHQHDIALIRLERSVDYNTFMRPICLPSQEPKDNETTLVAGWGKTQDNGDSSFVLLEVQLPVVVHERCVDMSAVSSNIFKDSNVCAGGEVGKDSCQGDSGGPLITQEDNSRWVLRGIVSWGHGCGETYPGVYTNVRFYLQWIAKRIFDATP